MPQKSFFSRLSPIWHEENKLLMFSTYSSNNIGKLPQLCRLDHNIYCIVVRHQFVKQDAVGILKTRKQSFKAFPGIGLFILLEATTDAHKQLTHNTQHSSPVRIQFILYYQIQIIYKRPRMLSCSSLRLRSNQVDCTLLYNI